MQISKEWKDTDNDEATSNKEEEREFVERRFDAKITCQGFRRKRRRERLDLFDHIKSREDGKSERRTENAK